jgi:DNA-directed RNA polymerase subunit E'/Rpb7
MFYSTSTTLPVALAPCWTGNEREGVTEYLNTFLTKYVPAVKGVVLSYHSVKPDTDCKIHNESPIMHLNTRVKLIHFSPVAGDLLYGVVNKFSADHIGLLVYGIFNASISAADHMFKYNEDEDVLVNGDVTVKTGNVLKFKVTSITHVHESWSISGTLMEAGTGVVEGMTLPTIDDEVPLEANEEPVEEEVVEEESSELSSDDEAERRSVVSQPEVVTKAKSKWKVEEVPAATPKKRKSKK